MTQTNYSGDQYSQRPDPIWVNALGVYVYPSETVTDPHTGRLTQTQPRMYNPVSGQWDPLPEQYWSVAFGDQAPHMASSWEPAQQQAPTSSSPTADSFPESDYQPSPTYSEAPAGRGQEANYDSQAVADEPAPAQNMDVFSKRMDHVDAEDDAIEQVMNEQARQEYPPRSSLRDSSPADDFDDDATVLSVDPISVTLRIDDGSTEIIHHDVILGRRPRMQPQYPGADVVKVVDIEKSMSKVHAHLHPVVGGVEVTDLNSTNGTWIVYPDGQREDVTSDKPVLATSGAHIHCGNRVITVEIQ